MIFQIISNRRMQNLICRIEIIYVALCSESRGNTQNHRFATRIVQSIKAVNLFESTQVDPNSIRRQQYYTQIYLVLLISSLSVLLFYSSIIVRTVTKRHDHPSIKDYEHLFSIYENNLECPCTKIAIPYYTFVHQLKVKSFHQVCSTKLVYCSFTNFYVTKYSGSFTNGADFSSWKNPFVYGLQQLCQTAQDSVVNSIEAFLASSMLVYQMMPQTLFNNKVNMALDRLKTSTPLTFARTLDLIRTTIQGNALIGMYSSNWKILMDGSKNTSESASFFSIPIRYDIRGQNTTCSCSTERSCSVPAQIFSDSSPSYTFDGLVFSCVLLESILRSSLSCFYNTTCIDGFRKAMDLNRYDTMQSWASKCGSPVMFDAESTRYAIDETIETMAYNMFIETWMSNVSYEMFFNACAPAQCTYTHRYRFDAAELFTSFLSIFSGLCATLYFSVPYFARVTTYIRRRFRIIPLHL